MSSISNPLPNQSLSSAMSLGGTPSSPKMTAGQTSDFAVPNTPATIFLNKLNEARERIDDATASLKMDLIQYKSFIINPEEAAKNKFITDRLYTELKNEQFDINYSVNQTVEMITKFINQKRKKPLTTDFIEEIFQSKTALQDKLKKLNENFERFTSSSKAEDSNQPIAMDVDDEFHLGTLAHKGSIHFVEFCKAFQEVLINGTTKTSYQDLLQRRTDFIVLMNDLYTKQGNTQAYAKLYECYERMNNNISVLPGLRYLQLCRQAQQKLIRFREKAQQILESARLRLKKANTHFLPNKIPKNFRDFVKSGFLLKEAPKQEPISFFCKILASIEAEAVQEYENLSINIFSNPEFSILGFIVPQELMVQEIGFLASILKEHQNFTAKALKIINSPRNETAQTPSVFGQGTKRKEAADSKENLVQSPVRKKIRIVGPSTKE